MAWEFYLSMKFCLTLLSILTLLAGGYSLPYTNVAIRGNTTLECSDGNKVLNILNVTFERRQVKCADGSLHSESLGEALQQAKGMCDDKKTCRVSRRMFQGDQPFLNELGYYNLSVDCSDEAEVHYACKFDQVDKWCGFIRYSDEPFRWNRKYSGDPDLPNSDHTHPNQPSKGLFAFVNQQQPSFDSIATLKKEIGFSELQVNEVCIVFWLFKRDSKHRIDIYYGDQKIHTLSDRYLYWTEIFVPLSVSAVPQFLTFSVSYNGVALDGGIAIDDFKILTSPCSDFTSQKCEPLKNGVVLDVCTNPSNIDLRFDPSISGCTPMYNEIEQEFLNNCTLLTNHRRCLFNLFDAAQTNAECFYANELQIAYNCTEFESNASINEDFSTASIMVTVIGLVVGTVCVAVVVIIIIYLRKHRRTQLLKNVKVGRNQNANSGQTDVHTYVNSWDDKGSIEQKHEYYSYPSMDCEYVNTVYVQDQLNSNMGTLDDFNTDKISNSIEREDCEGQSERKHLVTECL